MMAIRNLYVVTRNNLRFHQLLNFITTEVTHFGILWKQCPKIDSKYLVQCHGRSSSGGIVLVWLSNVEAIFRKGVQKNR